MAEEQASLSDALRAEVRSEASPTSLQLTYESAGVKHALEDYLSLLERAPAAAGGDVVGVDHVAYTFRSMRDLFENYAQLKDMGIKPYWCLHHGLTISLYYADPDGNRMEFQVD